MSLSRFPGPYTFLLNFSVSVIVLKGFVSCLLPFSVMLLILLSRMLLDQLLPHLLCCVGSGFHFPITLPWAG